MPESSATSEADYRASIRPEWQPYRDPEGNVVTFTPEQCAAIWHALDVYRSVIRAEHKKGTRGAPAAPLEALDEAFLMVKSCLLGRLLHDGNHR